MSWRRLALAPVVLAGLRRCSRMHITVLLLPLPVRRVEETLRRAESSA